MVSASLRYVPPSVEILALLTSMANELMWLAAGWHAVVVAVLTAAIAGWRPRARHGLWLLAAPALSVALAAFAFGNPFNAVTFSLLVIGLLAAGAEVRDRPAPRGSAVVTWLGAALIVYGACYPHFVSGVWYRSVYAAPVGVVPCPTLAVMAGVMLLAGGFGSRAGAALLALFSAFYALFGIFRLGVVLDAGLLVAAVALATLAWSPAPRSCGLVSAGG